MKKQILLAITAFFISITSNAQIVISELHYNPADEVTFSGDLLEFIELTNIGTTEVNITGYSFLQGITYVFPTGSTISANESIVLAKNKIVFDSFYNITAHGQYTGGLKNSGETIELIDGILNIISKVTYSDDNPWPVLADGLGSSLELTNPTTIDSYESWKSSDANGGSPGVYDNNATSVSFPIIVNEILANTDGLDKIELYNYSDSTVNIGLWYLTDDRKTPVQYQFRPNTLIEANSYLVLTSTDFESFFNLSNEGEEVYLFSNDITGLTGYSNGFSFDVSDIEQSYGVHTTSEGSTETFNLTSQTFGEVNDVPVVGPLVITDIMYNPDASNNEFLIIRNISDSVVSTNSSSLVDSNAIRVNGVDFKFDFTNPYTFEPNESFILTSITPTEFKTKYSIDNTINIFQYTGTLSNNSESLEIQIPMKRDIDTSATGVITYDNHYKTIDEVTYNDNSPWPTEADGDGYYLHRTEKEIYANDPIVWTILKDPLSVPLSTTSLKDLISSTLVYPNPTLNTLSISTDINVETYNVLTIEGNQILEGNYTNKIDVTSLESGIYIIQLNSTENTINKRFVKE